MRISDWSSDVCSSDLGPAGSGAADRCFYFGSRSFGITFWTGAVGGGISQVIRNAAPPPMSRISSTRSTAAKRMVADLDPVSGTVRRGRCAAGRPAEPGLATAARRGLPSDYGATPALYRPLESHAPPTGREGGGGR